MWVPGLRQMKKWSFKQPRLNLTAGRSLTLNMGLSGW